MKDLMKVQNHGNFHKYSICSCKVKEIQKLAQQIRIHEGAVFEGILGPYYQINVSQVLPSNVLRLAPEAVF